MHCAMEHCRAEYSDSNGYRRELHPCNRYFICDDEWQFNDNPDHFRKRPIEFLPWRKCDINLQHPNWQSLEQWQHCAVHYGVNRWSIFCICRKRFLLDKFIYLSGSKCYFNAPSSCNRERTAFLLPGRFCNSHFKLYTRKYVE